MKDVRPFPVLLSYGERKRFVDCPRSVPWGLLAPHEAQARINHDGQDLATLARRGGLGPSEMICILRDLHWREMVFDRLHGISEAQERECIEELKRLVASWESTPD